MKAVIAIGVMFVILAVIHASFEVEQKQAMIEMGKRGLDSLKQLHDQDSVCVHIHPDEFEMIVKRLEGYESDTFYHRQWIPDHILRLEAKKAYHNTR